VTVLLCCFGEISMKKSQGLLLMSIVVTVINIINLIVLEVSALRRMQKAKLKPIGIVASILQRSHAHM
jgi:hypothetical protein